MTTWQDHLPSERGTLPGGQPLRRTDPSGPPDAKIAILGVYPALTKKRIMTVGGTRMSLPVEVEGHSFEEGSASGAEINDNYLSPLGLTRDDVFITDMLPYFLANTTTSSSGRSMADNVSVYERETGATTGIEPRPKPRDLVRLASEMPGNLDRLRDYFTTCDPDLVFTLGTESAAFVRGTPFTEASKRVDTLLYGPAERLPFLGIETTVVHAVHPHLFIKHNRKWMKRHRDWCDRGGRSLVAEVLRGEQM